MKLQVLLALSTLACINLENPVIAFENGKFYTITSAATEKVGDDLSDVF